MQKEGVLRELSFVTRVMQCQVACHAQLFKRLLFFFLALAFNLDRIAMFQC